ncbi:MAG: Gfo/Idh/MocA family oxidoreductase [Clostridiales bacterium]|nr:Gfo/Idh/MocA family oxidoreductase [Clostridiales bacterium]
MDRVKVGIIGCGNISDIYLKNMTGLFPILAVRAVADRMPERATAAAAKYGIPKVYESAEALLNDPEIDIVVNLTTPPAHAPICMAALKAGKHVYVEKPLSIAREDGQAIVLLARRKGLMAGGAPDTFLGGGIQTCRRLIDEGRIGEPVAAVAFMTNHGHESWHPDPEFYYKSGGGPMLDMGPYYLTALVNLMGPVEAVSGASRITFPTRTIASGKKAGQIIDVEVPTHVAGLIHFASGAIGTIITSFDIWGAHLPRIEIYGSLGSLSVPDPNTFSGPVLLKGASKDGDWEEIPLTHGYADNSRGLGVADMAHALREGRPPRAGAELALHVLDIMQGFHDSSREGIVYRLETRCGKPAPMEAGERL